MTGRMVEEVVCTSRGAELYVAAYFHPRPRAIAIVAHSLTERISDCYALVQALWHAGFSVYLYDWRHQPCRTVWEMHRRPQWPTRREAVEDFSLVVDHATAREVEKNAFVVAHDEGAAVCVTYCAMHQLPKVAGVVLCTPTAATPMEGRCPSLRTMLGSCIWPRRHVTVMRNGQPERMELRRYRLCFQLAREAMNRAAQVRTPMLMVHGTNDAPEDIAACERIVEQATAIDKSLVNVDGRVEELWSQEADERDPRVQKIVEWLTDRAGA